MKPTIIFFGSFGKYSSLVLASLLDSSLVKVTKVVTTPAFENKKGDLIENEVQILAQKYNLPVLTPSDLNAKNIQKIISSKNQADFVITAGYGKLLPPQLLKLPKVGALNLHFSLLPKYRGANPGEWAILLNEKMTGVSVIEMDTQFDNGKIITQAEIPIFPTENRENLYEKLYFLGAGLLPQVISDYAQGKITAIAQPKNDFPYAARLQRLDGFVDWQAFGKAMAGEKFEASLLSKKLQGIAKLLGLKILDGKFLERATRALFGFPGIWTIIPTAKGQKRMKILAVSLKDEKLSLDAVQVEGKAKTSWREIKNILKN